jgi:hypothetical protein
VRLGSSQPLAYRHRPKDISLIHFLRLITAEPACSSLDRNGTGTVMQEDAQLGKSLILYVGVFPESVLIFPNI